MSSSLFRHHATGIARRRPPASTDCSACPVGGISTLCPASLPLSLRDSSCWRDWYDDAGACQASGAIARRAHPPPAQQEHRHAAPACPARPCQTEGKRGSWTKRSCVICKRRPGLGSRCTWRHASPAPAPPSWRRHSASWNAGAGHAVGHSLTHLRASTSRLTCSRLPCGSIRRAAPAVDPLSTLPMSLAREAPRWRAMQTQRGAQDSQGCNEADVAPPPTAGSRSAAATRLTAPEHTAAAADDDRRRAAAAARQRAVRWACWPWQQGPTGMA